MAYATYTCSALVGSNKAGELKPDKDGYYTVVLGALNFYNSAGQFYPLEPAKKLIDESSVLVRRASTGNLRSEYGHPKFQPGMTKKDYLYRIMDIHESNTCCHIYKVWIDDTSVKDSSGNAIVTILGLIKPSGPHGHVLEAQLKNPKENVCFSIRSITDDYIEPSGRTIKVLKEIFTWDYVNEPGISAANKWLSPALESLENVRFSQEHLVLAKNLATMVSSGMESEIANTIDRTMRSLGWGTRDSKSKDGLILPPSARW